jgi:flagellar hook-basal body complex protein FliE
MDLKVGEAVLAQMRHGSTAVAQPGANGGDFAKLLSEALGSATQAIGASETGAAQAAIGKADVTDLVAATTNAEVALETVVAIRDRVIGAYQDIIRMPI